MDREVMPAFVSSLNRLRSGKSPFLNFHTADGIGWAWNGNSITVPVPALRRRLSSSLLVSKLGATAIINTEFAISRACDDPPEECWVQDCCQWTKTTQTELFVISTEQDFCCKTIRKQINLPAKLSLQEVEAVLYSALYSPTDSSVAFSIVRVWIFAEAVMAKSSPRRSFLLPKYQSTLSPSLDISHSSVTDLPICFTLVSASSFVK